MDESSLSKLSFEELLDQVRVGAAGARDELVRRYQSRVTALLKDHREQAAKVGARPSDITQESLWKAVQHVDTFRGRSEGEWWKWLSRIVSNQVVETYRKGNRKRRDESKTIPLDAEEALEVRSGERSPSQVSAHQEEWRRLLSAFRWLEERQPDQHEALKLHYLEELSVRDIAERMGKTLKAVDGLMARGSRALEAYMAEEPTEEGALSPEDATRRNLADAAFSKYLRRREAGDRVEVEAFVAEHPDCAEELRGMLHWMMRLRELDPSRKP
ncbi:sigma-70 family RNA polymerase sigma factor [Myxococcus sp. AM011]|uniref:sigma-70 family RNA polymerase sigma factor n=1 Tax=Myxococcus sp. AM011 TaxID=2745200 RepID=UPI001595D825|nr:sigma-70 family RNA polymerase sigma factor [Myxococcus sp. AM011]NVJ23715.1 sigma-70 family RNA polymerase sigma factor [Myxococcus sp. AM011]